MINLIHCLCAGGLTLVLPPEIRVRGSELELCQIAQILGDDGAQIERARHVALGRAPAPGYSRVFQGWQLARELEKALPGVALEIQGARACRVVPDVEVLSGQAIADAARTELNALFGRREVNIVAQATVRDVEIPVGSRPRTLRVQLEGQKPHAGAWSVPVQVSIDETPYQTLWANFDVELFEELPVLVRAVQQGDVLGREAIEVRRVRLSNDATGTALGSDRLLSAIVERDLPAGSIVTERDVRRSRLVRQGDTIQLQVRKGAITARSSAVARQDGSMGDKIRVATPNSGRELTAQIVGRDLVELELAVVTDAEGNRR